VHGPQGGVVGWSDQGNGTVGVADKSEVSDVLGINQQGAGVSGVFNSGVGVYGKSPYQRKVKNGVVDYEDLINSTQRAGRFDGPVQIEGDLIINGECLSMDGR
jgi:hypothetical protein